MFGSFIPTKIWLGHVAIWYAISGHFCLGQDMLGQFSSCYTMLCHVMSGYVMLRRVYQFRTFWIC